MIESSTGIIESELLQWIESSLATGSHRFSAGYQGQTLKYEQGPHRLIIKVPHGRGLLRRFNIHLLRHEYAVYRRLKNFAGVPVCYGLVGDQYLVLQLIDGTTIKQQRPLDGERYFSRMLEYIKQMHAMGIAHFDLKKKTNLLVVDGNEPCLIDLGVAVVFKPGFHPFNHFLFNLAKQFDFNAWIKHKYDNNPANISPQDRRYFNKTRIEIYTYKIKRFYKDKIIKRLRRRLGRG